MSTIFLNTCYMICMNTRVLKNGSSLMDCLWGELYGSINAAEITDGVISHDYADHLRNKYLWK